MKKRIYLFFGIPLFVFAFILAGSFMDNSHPAVSDNAAYKGFVYTYTTGDFEGRESEPHVGISELVGVGSHNLLTTRGQNDIKAILGQGANYGAYDYIGLCNASSLGTGCTTPQVGDTALDNEYASGGLSRVQGTYSSLGDGYYSIYTTFTSSINGLTTNMTGLFNASSGGGMLAENTFTLVTLQSADQVTTNWTINISDGS